MQNTVEEKNAAAADLNRKITWTWTMRSREEIS